MDNLGKSRFGKWLLSGSGLVFIAFMIIAAFFLIVEHRVYLFGFLPYALLFLSLLLFLFLLRGAGGNGTPNEQSQAKDEK
ncbi:MAG: DUF2933 domain-containing protein [Chloroflexi bacterium]|nr:DUF2933 domain-containing protein [Chloroflexota bacterium]